MYVSFVLTYKYIEPKLEEMADGNYREAALTCTDADDIFDVLETIWAEKSHDKPLVAFEKRFARTMLASF